MPNSIATVDCVRYNYSLCLSPIDCEADNTYDFADCKSHIKNEFLTYLLDPLMTRSVPVIILPIKIGYFSSIRDIRRGGRIANGSCHKGAIHFTYVLDTFDEDGNVLRGHFNERLVKLMDELGWWTKALKVARESKKTVD